MAVIPLLAMIRKDLQLFFSDRRSVIVSFVVPIAIASFFGALVYLYAGLRAGATAEEVLARAETDDAPFCGSAELRAWVVQSLEELS